MAVGVEIAATVEEESRFYPLATVCS